MEDQIVFIHVSDPHMGGELLNRQFSRKWPATNFNAHDQILCRRLPLDFNAVCRETGAPANELPVIMSGDLTARGEVNEFLIAHSFFRSRLPVAFEHPLERVGLGLPDDRLMMVAGNHDHWQGWRGHMGGLLPIAPPGYNPALVPKSFYKTPWRRRIQSAGGKLELEIHAVDSSSGLAAYPLNYSALAGGSVSILQQKQLRRALRLSRSDPPAPGIHRIKALICHHALTLSSKRSSPWPLDTASANELKRLAWSLGVAAILTGHTHIFHKRDYVDPGGGASPGGATLREFRCGTTLQGPHLKDGQSFFVHQIALADGATQPTWRAWAYIWNGSQFRRAAGDVTDPPFPV